MEKTNVLRLLNEIEKDLSEELLRSGNFINDYVRSLTKSKERCIKQLIEIEERERDNMEKLNNGSQFVCELNEKSQERLKVDLLESFKDMNIDKEEINELLESALNGRLYDLQDTIEIKNYLR